MKTAISIPDALFNAAKSEAKRLGISRSKLHQLALAHFLTLSSDAKYTAAIDAYVREHGTEFTREDEIWLEHSRRTVEELLKDDKW